VTVTDYIIEKDIDVIAFTETWLSPGNKDDVTIANLCLKGYNFMHIPRCSGTGGGVGLLYKSSLDITKVTCDQMSTFEHLQVKLRYQSENVHLVVIYRPPPNHKNGFTFEKFNSEFCDLVDSVILERSKLLLAGDFNLHMDDEKSKEATVFASTLDSYGLQQHVVSPTHKHGHILDLVITRSDDDIVDKVAIDDGIFLSDHFSVDCTLKISKPPLPTKEVTARKIREINTVELSRDIEESPLCNLNAFDSVAELVVSYNDVLAKLLDKHAPLKTRTVTLHPQSPWYNAEIAEAKRNRRKAERRWRKSKLSVHRQLYIDARNAVKDMITKAKSSYYSDKIENAVDSKALFKIIDSLTSQTTSSSLPSAASDKILADDFSEFFVQKISKIREHLSSSQSNMAAEHTPSASAELSDFKLATEDEVRKLIMSTKSTTCDQDPIPTTLLKSCIDSLVPAITKIVNLSLECSSMPPDLKTATVLPLLKKICLDKEVFKNYRPISNLAYISKTIERIVASRLKEHMDMNALNEILQSAYKTLHSTESALLKVQDDILQALDQKKVAVLVLLDLSAAFDTVDHQVLIERLHKRLGISGNSLKWFKSYLTQRFQSISINSTHSDLLELIFGVPQGSVLGPLLFTIYTLPLGDILRKYNMGFHLYADDTQIYLSCEVNNLDKATSKIEACIREVKSWMSANFLRLNDDKTEIMLLGSKSSVKKIGTISLCIGQNIIKSSSHAKNIGAIIDNTMNMHMQINNTCRSAWFQLRRIGMIREHLSKQVAEKLIHAFVTSKLDFMNCLLFGTPKCQLIKLQRIQNAAARLVTKTKLREHITPVLINLHWLPIKQRIDYKILLFTYKALNGLAPQYICDMLTLLQNSRCLRSSNKLLLKVPRSNTATYGDRGFSRASPMLWNSLPEDIKNSRNLDTFKRNIKTHLFKNAFGNV
jgi:hypothetical protein